MPEHEGQATPPGATPAETAHAPGVPDRAGADRVVVEPPIAHELTGPLRCVSCRYELRGLSIKGNCPECGLPVRATLLSMIDPHALELQPIGRPRLVAVGLVVWAFGGVAALVFGLVAWAGVLIDGPLHEALRTKLVLGGATALGASGLGVVAIVRPHGGIPRRRVWAAVVALLLYPIAVRMYIDVGLYAAPGSGASLLSVWSGGADAMWWRAERLGLWLTLALATWLLRPNLRLLAARSLVLRSRRVDRQTIAATIAAMLIAAGGDAIGLSAGTAGDWGASLGLLAEVFVGLGMVLLTLGLSGVAIDTVRLLPAVLQRPLTMADVVAAGPNGADR